MPNTKYEAVQESLLIRIEGLRPHDRLPTERELAERFGVTRMTVRRALDRLEQERRVYRVQGAGTFVSDPAITKTLELTSFSEDMRSRGLRPGSRLEAAELIPAGTTAGRALSISPAETVVHLERVRTADDKPVCLEKVFLPTRVVPGLLEERLDGSLYDLLSHRYRITVVRAEQTVSASVLDTREAMLLEVPPVSPALVVVRTAYDQRGRAVEYAKTIYRGDRYSYRLTLERR